MESRRKSHLIKMLDKLTEENATLIAEHKMMREALEKMSMVNGMSMPTLTHRESIDHGNETLKKLAQ